MFDLPLDPELLEQRIGRLDRIGQTARVEIHLPYVENSSQEVVFRWFHEGLDAFARHLHGGRALLETFREEVVDMAQDFHETYDARRTELGHLLARTRQAREQLAMRLERGRDRLLELNSFRPGPAHEIGAGIAALDRETRLEEFLLRVWDHYGVPVEDAGPRTFRVGTDGVYADRFPGLPTDGMLATFDRALALSREDVGFLTWDHPMVTGTLDMLLGSREGTVACAVWKGVRERGLWMEVVHVLECPAPAKFHADRFLASTPVRILVNGEGGVLPAKWLTALESAKLEDMSLHELIENDAVRVLLEGMAAEARRHAEEAAKPLLQAALGVMETALNAEIERLRALSAVNPNVRADEVLAAESLRAGLRDHLVRSRLRCDSIRILVLGA